MTILFHFRTRGTGAEGVHIAGMASALEELGNRVIFSSPSGVNPVQTAGASPYSESGPPSFVARISRRLPPFVFELLELAYNLAAFLRNSARIKREKCDLIYERHAFFLCATAWVARRFRIPLLVEVNELVGDPRVRQQPRLAWLAKASDRILFRAANVIAVVSPHLKRRIEAEGIDGSKIVVLPNGVTRRHIEHLADPREVRHRHHLDEAIVVGFVGWFVAWHRLDLLFEAFAEVCTGNDRLKLLLVGEGELRITLEQLAKELGMAERVIFAGSVPHAEIPAHLGAMDICVVPHSNDYRSPIKLFEYMGQGRAVLAPRTEPIAMVIEDDVNGLLFEPGAKESIAAGLARLSASAELRRRLGERARADVLERFTWTKNAETLLQLVAARGDHAP